MNMPLLADPLLFFGGLGVFALIAIALTSIFWLWMLVDALTNTAINGTEKIIWILVIVFTHILGAILYFLLARGKSGGAATGV